LNGEGKSEKESPAASEDEIKSPCKKRIRSNSTSSNNEQGENTPNKKGDEDKSTAATVEKGKGGDNEENDPKGSTMTKIKKTRNRKKPKIVSASESFDKADFNAGLYHFILVMGNDNDKMQATGDLQRWIDFQNNCRKKQKKDPEVVTHLTPDRITVLNKVKFPWRLSYDERWDKHFDELVAFKNKHGNCRVPRGVPGLGEWVSTTRKNYKLYMQGKMMVHLNPERIKRLNSIKFEWNLNDWDENFRQLCLYMATSKDGNVPRNHGALGRWASYQRERYWDKQNLIKNGKTPKKSSITDEQVEKLEGAGFKWKAPENEKAQKAPPKKRKRSVKKKIKKGNEDEKGAGSGCWV